MAQTDADRISALELRMGEVERISKEGLERAQQSMYAGKTLMEFLLDMDNRNELHFRELDGKFAALSLQMVGFRRESNERFDAIMALLQQKEK